MFFKYETTIINLTDVQSVEAVACNRIRVTFKNGNFVSLDCKRYELEGLITEIYLAMHESK